MIEDRPSYYAIIPATVRYDKRLKANEKLLYGEITALSNKTGNCFASNKYFANLYSVSIETISRWISHLCELKYINTNLVYKNGKKEIEKRIISILPIPIDEKINTYCQKNQEGVDEKVKDNNTSINNNYYYSYNKSLVQVIEENFGRPISPIELEEISSWEDSELTRYAIKQSVLNGKYSIKYISKILYLWKQKNIKSVQEAQKDNEEFEKSKKIKSERTHYKSKYEREEEAMRRFLEADDD